MEKYLSLHKVLKEAKRLLLVLVVMVWSAFALLAQDEVSYTEIHTTAIDGVGKSGLVNALVGPGQDTTEVLQLVTALRISGSLNSSDCMILRNKMPNLEHLDMTDVEFVTGGNPYYGSNTVKADVFPAQLFYESILNNRLVSVNLPNSVKEIGTQAFSVCKSLQTVTFGTDLETIGVSAFNSCVQLTSLSLGDKVTNIGTSAFHTCSGLKEVILPASLQKLETTVFYNCTMLESIVIPNKVTSIGTNCFAACRHLKSVTLGSSVSELGSSCFANCDSLQTVVFNDELLSIGTSAFSNCKYLSEITFPESLTTLGASSFSGCINLSSIRLPMGLTNMGSGVFSGCKKLQEIHAPYINPTSITASAFTTGTSGQYSKVTLYVPAISYYAYYWDKVWGAFQNILTENYNYDPVVLNTNCRLSKEMPGYTKGAYNHLGYTIQKMTIHPTGSFVVDAGINQGAATVEMISDAERHPVLINHGAMRVLTLNLKVPLKGGEWHMFSFPRTISRTSITGLPSNADIREYDGTTRASGNSGWKTFSGSSFKVGNGYAIKVPTTTTITIKVTGQSLCSYESELSTPLSAYASSSTSDAGWNLVGNPFLSYYDIADLGITDPVVVFNREQGQYETYYPASDHYYLSPYEAFFVKKSTASLVNFQLAKRQIYNKTTSTHFTAASTSMPRSVCRVSSSGDNPPEPAIMSLVSVACQPSSEGTITGGGVYSIGSTPTFKVTPIPGRQVDHWTLNGNYYAGSLDQITYTVTAGNATLIAVMGERTTVDPGYDPDMPADPDPQEMQSAQVALRFKVSPAGTAKFFVNGKQLGSSNEIMVDAASLAHIKCVPNTNFTFNGWYLNGSRISSDAECDYMMWNRSITLLASVQYSPKNPNDPTITEEEAESIDIDNGQGVKLGDVNDDGTVDVSDAVQLITYIKDSNTDPERLIPLRCDVNLDDVVDLKDADAIVESYLARTRFTAADTLARQDTITDVIALSSISLEPGGDYVSLQVELTSSTAYTAFAMDIVLPEGIEADTTKLISPVSTHQIKYELLLDGGQALRVVCYNKDNRLMPSSLKIMLRLPLSAPPYTYPTALDVTVRHATLINALSHASVPVCNSANITIAEHTHIPLVISETNKYSTLTLPFAADLPTGARAAEGKNGNDTCLYLSEVTTLEPFIPYIIYAPSGINAVLEGDYLTTQYVPSSTIGYLTGVLVNTTINEGYVLQNHGDAPAFYMVISDVILPAGKVYLKRQNSSSSIALYRYDPNEMGEGTELEKIVPIEDVHNDIYFDYSGARVAPPYKPGFYLSNRRRIYIGQKYFR